MSKTLRSIAYVAAFVLPPLVLGAVRGKQYLSRYDRLPIAAPLPGESIPAAPAHDPSKPTVAVLLGADVTEITDALGPYEIFSRAHRYNVYMVAPERRPSLLTGGLRILPHLSLNELDARLGGHAAAVVVVPNIPNIKRAENQPLLGWMRSQAATGALMHSWCTGAMALAESGLLDGRRATAHWGDIRALEHAYPKVTWVRGVRWVEDEGLVASAGINSGIDASLRVLVRRDGDSVARRVAAELRYPNFRYAEDPAVTQLEIRPSDAVLFVNAAFRSARSRLGVALYEGVGELAISNVYDAYAATAAAEVYAVATDRGVVRTRFGATLLPSLATTQDSAAIRGLDRMVVTGEAQAAPRAVASAVTTLAPGLPATWIDSGTARYPLESVLEDLARTADLPSARFAERRLEYRSDNVELRGSVIPWNTLPVPLGAALLGALLTWVATRSTTRPATRSAAAAAVIASALAVPRAAHAQSADSLAAGARIRIGVRTAERTLLRRPKTQALVGTLVAARGDTLWLAVQPGADPLRVPRTTVSDIRVSLGVPNRFESAARRAVLPTLASAAFTAVSLNMRRRDGDPSPGRGAIAAAGSTAAVSALLGFVDPKERWQRLRRR
jgi:transcriptional regulator GlxA family with amidase domain